MVESRADMGFKRILIAVDESPIAAHAADIGISLANCLDGEVAFMHVVDTSHVLVSPKMEMPMDQPVAIAEQKGRKLLAAFRDRQGTSLATVEFLETGKPETKIVEGAKHWSADLIVIASHGHRGI